jgi:hypothetical protein
MDAYRREVKECSLLPRLEIQKGGERVGRTRRKGVGGRVKKEERRRKTKKKRASDRKPLQQASHVFFLFWL